MVRYSRQFGIHGPRLGNQDLVRLDVILAEANDVDELSESLAAYLKDPIVSLLPRRQRRLHGLVLVLTGLNLQLLLQGLHEISNRIVRSIHPDLHQFVHMSIRIHQKNHDRNAIVLLLLTRQNNVLERRLQVVKDLYNVVLCDPNAGSLVGAVSIVLALGFPISWSSRQGVRLSPRPLKRLWIKDLSRHRRGASASTQPREIRHVSTQCNRRHVDTTGSSPRVCGTGAGHAAVIVKRVSTGGDLLGLRLVRSSELLLTLSGRQLVRVHRLGSLLRWSRWVSFLGSWRHHLMLLTLRRLLLMVRSRSRASSRRGSRRHADVGMWRHLSCSKDENNLCWRR